MRSENYICTKVCSLVQNGVQNWVNTSATVSTLLHFPSEFTIKVLLMSLFIQIVSVGKVLFQVFSGVGSPDICRFKFTESLRKV